MYLEATLHEKCKGSEIWSCWLTKILFFVFEINEVGSYTSNVNGTFSIFVLRFTTSLSFVIKTGEIYENLTSWFEKLKINS